MSRAGGNDISPTNRSGESACGAYTYIIQYIADMSRAGGNGSGESACVEHMYVRDDALEQAFQNT